MRALLFPGQGSQTVGMGKALAAEFEPARLAFEEADDALGFSISRLCFEGPEDELTRTENTQPAILATSVAVLRTLETERGLMFDVAAGHSLGEFSALVAARALHFADALRLVRLRGQAMQEAVPQGQGAMAALIGLDADVVAALCAEAAQGQVCEPANFNGGGQVVISGHAEAIDRAVAAAEGKGAKRAVRLAVSAPFHCALMKPAADRLAEALEGVQVHAMQAPVVANVTAEPSRDQTKVKELLIAQVTGSVRWEESVQALARMGIEQAIEVGAGSVLRGLARRITRDIKVVGAAEPEDIRKVEV